MTTDTRLPAEPADKLLDLLLDALQERQATRRVQQPASAEVALHDTEPSFIPADAEIEKITPKTHERVPKQGELQPDKTGPLPLEGECGEPTSADKQGVLPSDQPCQATDHLPAHGPAAHLPRTIRGLVLAVLLLVALINLPINRYGASLARIVPDTASLVLRDGLVLKAPGPDIYVLQDNKLRWISSLDAFEYFGYRWDEVHVVDDQFLKQFETGRPVHVLLKCDASPHIYALENGTKRWIRDISTFEGQGYVWSDVKSVNCDYLAALPHGPSIPEDAGPPPQP
jgi:hypothetical protein